MQIGFIHPAVSCLDPPPETPRGALRFWDGRVDFGTEIEYTCGADGLFKSPSTGETYPVQTAACGWDGRWSPEARLDPCLWSRCQSVPVPPASSGLSLSDEEGANPLLPAAALRNGVYAPGSLPASVPAPAGSSFWGDRHVLVRGLVLQPPEERPLPFVLALTDAGGSVVFSMSVDPTFAIVTLDSELPGVKVIALQ